MLFAVNNECLLSGLVERIEVVAIAGVMIVGSLLQSNIDHYKAEAAEYRAVDHSYIQDGETVRSGHDVPQIPAECLAEFPSALFLSAEQQAAQWLPVWRGGTALIRLLLIIHPLNEYQSPVNLESPDNILA